MAPGCVLDTNVLLYVVSTDPGEAAKRELASASPFTLQAITWRLASVPGTHAQGCRHCLKMMPWGLSLSGNRLLESP